ncbi:Bni5p SKDI_14G1570 [Saccharomyces kudriavzevii IFO 1802]|uniref:BNI5-like protein n=2 Tax=Saccharomyces kudriavzevii (strain ATCC MYA-4449 / AS 2.2408 / CBS 8840 / NBRC 1802 / NCYC 2889) TaxID=226230 RepID=J6E9I1_SACK1|nr:uncharacterized protein SKDI_14G1570 [Saccharomyces kudriavzevii IFO 1802]EJT41254.1 BNI5-like protein [Saccharomyces kudriavzevii IFO 1802]CAI4049740.1 hypothetical protein SKDI_14G1570 [Saccharomyces kudriavzevii IFO 1802]
MGLDQDKIKKRLSQIEIDINQMNQMIDENLQLVDSVEDESAHDDIRLTGVTDTPEMADTTIFLTSNSTVPVDAAQPEVEHETSPAHIPNENGTNKSMEAQHPHPQTVTVEEQMNHTTVAIGDSYNAFIANSTGNEQLKNTHTEIKLADTTNVNQNGVDIETVKNNDDEWEDEKFDVGDERTDKETEEKNGTPSFEPPNRQNITFAGHRKADTELILDEFSSCNKDQGIHPQTISVGSNNEDDYESKHLADQTTDTSEVLSSPSGRSTPLDSQTKIFIPKKNSKEDDTDASGFNTNSYEQKKVPNSGKRRTTNPFRVISVSNNSNSRGGSRKSSLNKYDSPVSSPITSASELGNAAKLEKRHDYLAMKCIKLQKEIDYLNKMNAQGSLSMEDGKRLHRAVVKLQEYLDKKTKEKYEVGVLLSRQLRKQIDRGENGQFWIGTK